MQLMPKAKFVPDNAIIDRMQKIRSPREIEMFARGGAADLDRHAGRLSRHPARA